MQLNGIMLDEPLAAAAQCERVPLIGDYSHALGNDVFSGGGVGMAGVASGVGACQHSRAGAYGFDTAPS